eukprot:5679510-Lingulodinium_polyedra.AAC.1
MQAHTPSSAERPGALFLASPMPAGSTKPCATAQAKEPPLGRGLSARRKCAACATAPCSVIRMARCGPAA